MIQLICALLFFGLFWWFYLSFLAQLGSPKRVIRNRKPLQTHFQTFALGTEFISVAVFLMFALLSAFFLPQGVEGQWATGVTGALFVGFSAAGYLYSNQKRDR